MDLNELKEILAETAERISKEENQCGKLVFSQNKIREPELRDVLGRVLSEHGVSYGIEVPTGGKFAKSGTMVGRVDLSVYKGGKPVVHVELKEGQTPIDEIAKDFEKMMLDKVEGASFFHVLQNENSKTVKALLEKYEKAYAQAKAKLQRTILPKWFVLFIFTVKGKKRYCKAFENIVSIPSEEFSPD